MGSRCTGRRCAALCAVLLLLTQVWHRLACRIFVQTCSPISLSRLALLAFNLDLMPVHDRATSSGALAVGGAGRNASRWQCAPAWREGEPRWAVLLASPKSGSTFVQQMLHSHPRIHFGRERLLPHYRDCRQRHGGSCPWAETRSVLEQVFRDYRKEYWYGPAMSVVGYKIQYDHIPPELRPEFARWLACNQISVLHLSRGAVVESFWTLQAEVYDIVQLKGEAKKLQVSSRGTSARPHQLHSNRRAIPLEPGAASEYVRAVEAQRADYRQLLLYGPSRYPRTHTPPPPPARRHARAPALLAHGACIFVRRGQRCLAAGLRTSSCTTRS